MIEDEGSNDRTNRRLDESVPRQQEVSQQMYTISAHQQSAS